MFFTIECFKKQYACPQSWLASLVDDQCSAGLRGKGHGSPELEMDNDTCILRNGFGMPPTIGCWNA